MVISLLNKHVYDNNRRNSHARTRANYVVLIVSPRCRHPSHQYALCHSARRSSLQ